jgi:hypothetical protein
MPLPENPYEIVGKRFTKDDVAHTVVALTQGGVLLYGDDGSSVTIPPWKWPAGFHSASAQQEACRVRIAMIVGGRKGSEQDKRIKKAEKLRVDARYHEPGFTKFGLAPIPPDVEFVIFVRGSLNHNMYEHYVKQCRDRGINHAAIDFRGFGHKLQEWLENTYDESYGFAAPRGSCPVLSVQGHWRHVGDNRWVWVQAHYRDTPTAHPPEVPQSAAPMASDGDPRGLTVPEQSDGDSSTTVALGVAGVGLCLVLTAGGSSKTSR